MTTIKESKAFADTISQVQSDSQTAVEWSYNPWTAKAGPAWRQPPYALALSIAISLMLGFSMAYPNIPESYIANLEQVVSEQSDNAAAQDELAGLMLQQEIWPQQLVGWAGISLLLLLAMTSTLYLEVRYRLDPEGVTVFFLGAANFRKWQHYRNFYVHDTGVHLTTMPKPSPLDPFRGHFLRFDQNRDEVVAYIKGQISVENTQG